jgi:hypothetical protein
MTRQEPPRMVLPWSALLLDVWRQVSEHLDVEACAEQLVRRLQHDLPIARLRLLRVDGARCRVTGLAASPWTGADPDALAVRSLAPAQVREVESWIAVGRVEPLPPRVHRALHPTDGHRSLLAGGLVDAGVPVGVVEFEGGPELGAHLELLRALLAPLVVAWRARWSGPTQACAR